MNPTQMIKQEIEFEFGDKKNKLRKRQNEDKRRKTLKKRRKRNDEEAKKAENATKNLTALLKSAKEKTFDDKLLMTKPAKKVPKTPMTKNKAKEEGAVFTDEDFERFSKAYFINSKVDDAK